MKKCSKCKQIKSLDSFYKNRNYGDGYVGWCKQCHKQYRDEPDNRNKRLAQNKIRGLKIKKIVMDKYGGKCSCCGETELAFLTIDHVNGHGKKHLKSIGLIRGGRDFYYWLCDRDVSPDFQVLCFNCNCGRRINGGICPHKS